MRKKGTSAVIRISMIGALLLLTMSLPQSSSPAGAVDEAVRMSALRFPHWGFDIRQFQAVVREPTLAQQTALERLRERIGRDLTIRFDPLTGGVRHLFHLTRLLTPPQSGDPVEVALTFLRNNADLFGLTPAEITSLRVARNYRTPHNGVVHLAFQQSLDGLEVLHSDLRVNLLSDGRLVSINGRYFPHLIPPRLDPILTASEAVVRAVRVSFPDLEFSPRIKHASTRRDRFTLFDRGDMAEDISARLVIFPAYDRARLGWRIRLHLPERSAWYDLVLDAHTGEVLYRQNLYVFDQPQGLVFEVNPDVGPQVLKSFIGDPLASPTTWVFPPPNARTAGNNAFVLPAPVSSERQFLFPFLNQYERVGASVFDLDRKTLRFAPNAKGGYDVSLAPFRFDQALGINMTSSLRIGRSENRNDGSLLLELGFGFPFFGTVYRAVYVNANGNVTFTGPSASPTESAETLAFGLPRIACLWDDLDLRSSGALFVKVVGPPTPQVVITWMGVPELGAANANTCQLTLASDGTIEMSYNGVSLRDGLVGLSRGMGEMSVRFVDFSELQTPLRGTSEGLFEFFPSVELEMAATNLFYHLNFMHDYLYRLGFNEAAGNFQVENFGRGGLGNDPVIGFVQAAGTNNANFGTPEDGFPPVTRYFLFTPPNFRQVDPSLDADVIYHEYVHGLTNRLVGGPHNVAALAGFQSGALGEGWSDAYAASITNDPVIGEYEARERDRGIRTVRYDRSPLTYGDFGNRRLYVPPSDVTVGQGPIFYAQVHTDGEIWASTLWDLRTALGRAYFEQLITDGLKFTPPTPSMLEARDAILLADKVNANGAHLSTIWRVFAARGMGFSAETKDGNDTLVFEAFDTPSDPLPPVKAILFEDDMESGERGWAATGLWHRSARRSGSGGAIAWYYGQESTGDYETGGPNFGTLTSPPLTLPALSGSSALVLEFDHFFRRADGRTPFDCGFIRIVDTASGTVVQKAFVINNTPTRSPFVESIFERRRINLSEFAGRTIRIQFYFDTLDRNTNTGEGWYIDNVRVVLHAR
ncbi:MAG: M36 family metallopeptidase [Blastocatellia bacterium]|nr:M36 family metallopeptidase [Blastocatellia bacterium]MCS7157987.1 M36 family metallopeptidase [Blastocatellia bacterium]MCX7752494.1 M36 family metallopeptidase [Blastocatellia bacterium]MDW8167391.1 M36 family metallopeptidase [Acidobacteriota bacterium]MDW8257431.1 M36 family metallopeptidase [Acidobacteriota bacterium]